MPYYQNVKLPKRTKQALVGSPNVPNVSKAVRDVMLKYAGNKEATFALLLRHMQRKMVSGHKATQEEMCKTTVSSDPNLYKEFAEIAHLFDQSYDFLLKAAIEDFLLNDLKEMDFLN